MVCLILVFLGVIMMWSRGVGVTCPNAHLGWFGLGCIAAGVWMVPLADKVF